MTCYSRLKGLGLDLLVYRDHSEMGIRKTSRTPFVWIQENGEITVAGRLIPDHSFEYLNIIEEWLMETNTWNRRSLKIHLELEYITAVASKLLLRLLTKLKAHCQKMEITWYFDRDQTEMLELGIFLNEILVAEFQFIQISKQSFPLDRQYRKCLADTKKQWAILQKEIRELNESGNYINLSLIDINENLVKRIKGKYFKKRVREMIAMKSRFLELNRQLEQLRLSVMLRDLRESRELNDDIRMWRDTRY